MSNRIRQAFRTSPARAEMKALGLVGPRNSLMTAGFVVFALADVATAAVTLVSM